MPVTQMGYEFKIYYGPAGSQANVLITNSLDADYNIDPTMGATASRGSGSTPVIETERVTALKPTITLKMLNKTNDTTLAALLAAQAAGAPVAIRTRDNASGKGYDGDCNVSVKQGAPLKGEQTFDFTFTANDDSRTPSLWA